MAEQWRTRVLKEIKPSASEQKDFLKLSNSFLDRLNKELASIGAKAILGGSAAKDTWLKESKDIDVFVQFPLRGKISSKGLSDALEKVLRKVMGKKAGKSLERLHGSRDYFQVEFEKHLFEIVPILEIKSAEEAKNITDISPLHAVWVNEVGAKLKDDIRLAKQFCRANKLYGAESYIGGFSGYMLEILVLHYGSFLGLLEGASKWKAGGQVVIDTAKLHKSKAMALFNIDNAKLQGPLVLVDPVDKHRNAAAALSVLRFDLFRKRAKEFLRKPGKEFFILEKLKIEKLALACSSQKKLAYVEFNGLEGKRDVVGAKLLKIFGFLSKELDAFGLLGADWQWSSGEKAKMYFYLKSARIPDRKTIAGPPVELVEHAQGFRKKHGSKVFEKKGKLFAKVRNRYPAYEDFFEALLERKYVLEKVKSVEKVIFA